MQLILNDCTQKKAVCLKKGRPFLLCRTVLLMCTIRGGAFVCNGGMLRSFFRKTQPEQSIHAAQKERCTAQKGKGREITFTPHAQRAQTCEQTSKNAHLTDKLENTINHKKASLFNNQKIFVRMRCIKNRDKNNIK